MPISSQKIILGVALLITAVSAGFYWSATHKKVPVPVSVESVAPKEILTAIAKAHGGQEAAKIAVMETVDAKLTSVVYTGNGKDKLHLIVKNGGTLALRLDLHAGDVFDGRNGRVVLLRTCNMEIAPGKTTERDLPIMSGSFECEPGDGEFSKSSASLPRLEPLMKYLESHPNLAQSVVQTAVLALGCDAPVDVFAKFPRLQRAAVSFDPGAYKVDTGEIIEALQMLREAGVASCTLGDDPQLKIEAMMDPHSHDLAMHYYGIDEDAEWSFWKHELLEGDPSTRHYALYGIARFHPDVALQMMPKWVREHRTAQIYRLAAVGALALTHKPEAEPLLKTLQQEFAQETDVAQSTDRALRYLQANINHPL